MALTLTRTVEPEVHSFGSLRAVILEVDFDASYPTGGESLTAANLGLSSIAFIVAEPRAGYVFEYDRSASKLKAYYGDYNNAADGALIEVPDTTDLSAVTDVRVLVLGRAA